jgi:hypothetical protein
VRPPTDEEMRIYSTAYGERMNELLTPEMISRLVGMVEAAPAGAGRQRAQELLGKLGTRASTAAWRHLTEETGVTKGNKRRNILRMRQWPWQTED